MNTQPFAIHHHLRTPTITWAFGVWVASECNCSTMRVRRDPGGSRLFV